MRFGMTNRTVFSRGNRPHIWFGLMLAFVTLLSTLAVADETMVLVQNGQSNAVVVIPEDAPRSLRMAAHDFVDYVDRISGARLSLVSAPPENAASLPIVWLGLRPEAVTTFAEFDLDFAEPEETIIACNGQHLLIAGRDRMVQGRETESGSANAIYTFLQKHLDVRWLWPGELGIDIVEQDSLAFEPFVERYHPQLQQRRLRMSSFKSAYDRLQNKPDVPNIETILREKDKAVSEWNRRQRLAYGSFNMRATHAFQDWWDRFHETNPDWFALQYDGGRGRNITTNWSTDGKHIHLCLSNPEVWEQWWSDVARQLENNPQYQVFSASPNDSVRAGYCRCENCRAWDPSEGPMVNLVWDGLEEEHVSLTDRHVRFWNQLARGLTERYPDRSLYVGAWAYAVYRDPPVETELEPNVAVGFVANLPASSSESRASDRKNWQAWADQATRLIWRPNLGHTGSGGGLWGLPLVYTRRSGEDFQFLADNKMIGLDVDSIYHHWATQGVQYYVLAQLAWNPRRSVEDIVSDYYQRAFGPAAEHVRQYFEQFEEIQYEIFERGASRQEAAESLFPELYDNEVIRRARNYLEQAAAAVQSENVIYQQRIEFLKTGLAFIESQIDVMRVMTGFRSGDKTPAEAIAAYHRKQRIAEQNIESFAIGYPQYLRLKQWRSMERYLGPVTNDNQYSDLRPLRSQVVGIDSSPSLRIRGEATALVYADVGEQVDVELISRPMGSYEDPLSYYILSPSGNLLDSGQVDAGETAAIRFEAREPGIYQIEANAELNTLQFHSSNRLAILSQPQKRLHLVNPKGTFYFWVRPGTRSFTVEVRGRSDWSLVRAKIVNRDSEIVYEQDMIDGRGHQFTVDLPQSSSGEVWRLDLGAASEGRLQDAYVILDASVSPCIAMHPDTLLIPDEIQSDAGDPSVE